MEVAKKFLLLVFCIVVSSACKTIQVPNTEFCVDTGPYGASCFYSDSDQERDIEKAAWDDERIGMVCTTGASYGEWKAALMKLCSETKICKREDTEKAIAVLTKIQTRSERARLRRR